MMWNRKELKAKGKAAFRANYWRSVLVALIAVMILGGSAAVVGNRVSQAGAEQNVEVTETQDTETAELSQALEEIPPEILLGIVVVILGVALTASMMTTLVSALLFNPLKVGCQRFFLVNSDSPAGLPELLYGYQSNYGNMVKTLLLRDIFLWLWSLLFCIPAVVKNYSYRLVPYILAENPSVGSREAITLSRRMMNGHKWNAFVMDLSFIGWNLLSAITFGLVGVLYAAPYQYAANAELYKAIRDLSKEGVYEA